MLQVLLSDQTLWYVAFHTFAIGAILGFLISYRTIHKMKRKLRSQSKAYQQLMDGINATPKVSNTSGKDLQVIRMDTGNRKVSGLAL